MRLLIRCWPAGLLLLFLALSCEKSYLENPPPSGSSLIDRLGLDTNLLTYYKIAANSVFDTLFKNQGSYTVFAADTAAFHAFGVKPDTIFTQADLGKFKPVLLYNTLPRRRNLKSLLPGKYVTLLANPNKPPYYDSLTVTDSAGTLIVNHLAHIVKVDCTAYNGTIYTLDRLLLPPR